jgi:hypothetical protein
MAHVAADIGLNLDFYAGEESGSTSRVAAEYWAGVSRRIAESRIDEIAPLADQDSQLGEDLTWFGLRTLTWFVSNFPFDSLFGGRSYVGLGVGRISLADEILYWLSSGEWHEGWSPKPVGDAVEGLSYIARIATAARLPWASSPLHWGRDLGRLPARTAPNISLWPVDARFGVATIFLPHAELRAGDRTRRALDAPGPFSSTWALFGGLIDARRDGNPARAREIADLAGLTSDQKDFLVSWSVGTFSVTGAGTR